VRILEAERGEVFKESIDGYSGDAMMHSLFVPVFFGLVASQFKPLAFAVNSATFSWLLQLGFKLLCGCFLLRFERIYAVIQACDQCDSSLSVPGIRLITCMS